MKRGKKLEAFILRCLQEDVTNAVQGIGTNNPPSERYVAYLEGKLAAFRIANVITDEDYENFFNQLVDAGVAKRFSYESLYSTNLD